MVYNENAKASSGAVLDALKALVGSYHLYAADEESTSAGDPVMVSEAAMQQRVLENFAAFRETLVESLMCEDYEDEGLLELQ